MRGPLSRLIGRTVSGLSDLRAQPPSLFGQQNGRAPPEAEPTALDAPVGGADLTTSLSQPKRFGWPALRHARLEVATSEDGHDALESTALEGREVRVGVPSEPLSRKPSQSVTQWHVGERAIAPEPTAHGLSAPTQDATPPVNRRSDVEPTALPGAETAPGRGEPRLLPTADPAADQPAHEPPSARAPLVTANRAHDALAEPSLGPPSRPRSLEPPPTLPVEALPSLTIEIGRIDIHTPPSLTAATAPIRPPARPRLDLKAYLAQRRSGER